MKCGFFENVLSRAWTIHADGDKWAGRGRYHFKASE
jgi:hypothetical protein